MEESGKKYFRIREVAEMLEENASTLRFWEKEFPSLKPMRGSGGSRLYTEKEIETFRIIKYLLRTKGLHISVAREQMKTNSKNITTRIEALNELYEVRDTLKSMLAAFVKRKI